MFLHLPTIDARLRREEAELWESFRADYPAMFGGLLDAVAGGLREMPQVRLPELPRMADFARFGEAVGRGLGWPDGSFTSVYDDNRRDNTLTCLEESLIATTLLDNAAMDGLVNWTLSATEMLEDLTKMVPRKDAATARWPKTPKSFANELRRIVPSSARGE